MEYVINQIESFRSMPALGQLFCLGVAFVFIYVMVRIVVRILKCRNHAGDDTGHPPT